MASLDFDTSRLAGNPNRLAGNPANDALLEAARQRNAPAQVQATAAAQAQAAAPQFVEGGRFNSANPVNPNVSPERLTALREARNVPYTGAQTGAPNGQTAGTQNFTANASAGAGQNITNGPGGVETNGVPRGNAPAGGGAQAGQIPQPSLRQGLFGSSQDWGGKASNFKQAVADKLTYQPAAATNIAPGAMRRMAGGLGKLGGVVSGAVGAYQVPGDLREGNYGDAAVHSADALAGAAMFTPAAPAAALYGVGRTAQVIGNAIGESLPASVQDKIGSAVNTGLRGAGNLIGQNWGVDDSAYKASLRNPQPTTSAVTQPSPTTPRPAANPAQPAANTQPTATTNTLRGQSGTDMGGGISKFVQNGKTLYSNMPGGDDALMNRGPTSAQNQSAMDGIQLRQDQGDAAYAAKRQYDSEVADAQVLRGGGDLASRIARQGPNHAVASMLADQQNKTALRGQDIMREGHFLTNDVAKANARYQMNKDKRDYDTGRSDHASVRGDKAFEQRQQATKDLHTEIGNMLPPGADGKPDLTTASRYATGLTAHVAGVADSYRKRAAAEPNNPAVRDWLDTAKHLDTEGPKALDATAKQRLMAGMQAKDTETANHSSLNPFGGTSVQTNAPVTSLKLKPGVFSDDYISTHADGSQGKIPRRKIDGGWFEPANASYDSLKVK